MLYLRFMKQWFKLRLASWAGLGGLLLLPGLALAQQAPPPDSVSLDPSQLLEPAALEQLRLRPDTLAAEPLPVIDSARLAWLRTPPTLRDLVCDRVGCLETDVPHQFNNAVMAYVTLFTARNRAYMQRVLERENFYFPIFEKYLTQYNLPTDLKYLAVVESSLIPTAKSPVGATGLWQFMGPTAGDLHLRRDEWVDERMHPEKATEAACKHLRYLYGVFHDWELVLAAYNWGAGNVQRVMRRTGKKTFWDLYPNLPAETRNYVPTFTAIMYSMKYAEAHGLHSDKLAYRYAESLDTLGLTGQAFDLRRLSRACGYADSTYLTRFNPELRTAGLPAGYRPYVLRYPAAARSHLGDVDRATLLAYCQPGTALPALLVARPVRLAGVEPFPTRPLLAATDGPRAEVETEAPRFRRVQHKVKRGETLAALAERFEVSQTKLRHWNDLPKGRALRPGRSLVIFVSLPAPAALRPAVETVAKATLPPPAVPDETAAARRDLAAANARETARLAALAEQERHQEAEVARLRQRQVAVRQATEKALAQVAAAQAAQEKLVGQQKATLVARRSDAGNNTLPLAAADSDEAKLPALVRSASGTVRSRRTKNEAAPSNYTVRKGDYLTQLARENDLTVAQLMAWNQLESETVVPGQVLRLRAPEAAEKLTAAETHRNAALHKGTLQPTHTVQPGDTLYNISRRFGLSVDELRELNHITGNEVKLGQKLVVGQG